MSRSIRVLPSVLVALAGVAGLLVLVTPPSAVSQEITAVAVTNFPDPQNVVGKVSLEGPMPRAQQVAFREVQVPPVGLTETTRMIDAGVLDVDGFPGLVLSLHGQVKGAVRGEGEVGAILIPDEPSVRNAFDETGAFHFGLRVRAEGIRPTTSYFASDQPRFQVGFERYRVLLYNTTDKTVTANLFAYLTD